MDSDLDEKYLYTSEEEEEEEAVKKEADVFSYKDEEVAVSEPNIKCSSCKKKFILGKKQSVIRCVFCGHRILYKLRTKNSIYYSTD